MRRLLVALTIVGIVFVAVNRQRLYLWDPVGGMFVNDARVGGARVYINFSNDVLVLGGGRGALIVQGWDGVPGRPGVLRCVRGMACLADGDRVDKVPVEDAGKAEMSNRGVAFRDKEGAVRVVIR